MFIKIFTFSVYDLKVCNKHNLWSYGSAMVTLHEGQNRPSECDKF